MSGNHIRDVVEVGATRFLQRRPELWPPSESIAALAALRLNMLTESGAPAIAATASVRPTSPLATRVSTAGRRRGAAFDGIWGRP